MVTSWYEPIVNPTRTFIVGLDLGQAQDHTGLITIEQNAQLEPTRYDVLDIQRLPLGISYPRQIAHILRVVQALYEQRSRPIIHLVADFTGVGRPIADALEASGVTQFCSLHLVTITGGDSVTGGIGGQYRVPKRDLASAVLV